ncbi:MAG: hypothetical protein U0263_17050 [Polyangiaceae bacterium]
MRAGFVFASIASVLIAGVARAEEAAPSTEGAPPAAEGAAPAAASTEAAAPLPAPKKPPYSLPWQLRPVVPGNVVRSDTSLQFFKPKGADSGGTTIASTLLASYKVMDNLAPLVRLGFVNLDPPVGDSGSALLNPVVGAIYGMPLSPEMKLGLFLGIALPLGSGGGDAPKAETAAALGAGMAARRYMDNAMFAVNFLTVYPGVGFAYVADGLTVQAEVTLLQLQRVKGDKVEPDKSKTNLTTGLHVGYFVMPELSIGAELNYQRWLSGPKKPAVETRNQLVDNLSVAIGPRVHLKVGENLWIRPGIAYARFLDKPMGDSDQFDSNHVVQIDIPVAF